MPSPVRNFTQHTQTLNTRESPRTQQSSNFSSFPERKSGLTHSKFLFCIFLLNYGNKINHLDDSRVSVKYMMIIPRGNTADICPRAEHEAG